MDIVVTGDWDGEVIWRKKTAKEKLSESLNEINCFDCKDTGTTVIGEHDNLIEVACHCTKGGDYAEVTDNPNYE